MSFHILHEGDPHKVWNSERKSWCGDLDAEYGADFSYASIGSAKATVSRLLKSGKIGNTDETEIVDRETLFDRLGVNDWKGSTVRAQERVSFKDGFRHEDAIIDAAKRKGKSVHKYDISSIRGTHRALPGKYLRNAKIGDASAYFSFFSVPLADGKHVSFIAGSLATHGSFFEGRRVVCRAGEHGGAIVIEGNMVSVSTEPADISRAPVMNDKAEMEQFVFLFSKRLRDIGGASFVIPPTIWEEAKSAGEAANLSWKHTNNVSRAKRTI